MMENVFAFGAFDSPRFASVQDAGHSLVLGNPDESIFVVG